MREALSKARRSAGLQALPGRTLATVGVLVALQLPLGGWLLPGDSLGAKMARESLFWLLTLMLICYVLLVERRPLSSVGLARPTWRTGVTGLGVALLLLLGAAAIVMVLFPMLGLKMNEQGMSELKSTPPWFLLSMLVRAAVFEELFYRGFAIERLTEITHMPWLASVISIAGFTLAHLSFWGWTHLILAGFGGIVLTGFYLLRRDLLANMLAHFAFDVCGFILG
jgi:uncharacterized protein